MLTFSHLVKTDFKDMDRIDPQLPEILIQHKIYGPSLKQMYIRMEDNIQVKKITCNSFCCFPEIQVICCIKFETMKKLKSTNERLVNLTEFQRAYFNM